MVNGTRTVYIYVYKDEGETTYSENPVEENEDKKHKNDPIETTVPVLSLSFTLKPVPNKSCYPTGWYFRFEFHD